MADAGGFSDGGLEMLASFDQRDTAWFDANRPAYVPPGLTVPPKLNGNVSPINNDLRFNPGASLCRDHLTDRWREPIDASVYSRLRPLRRSFGQPCLKRDTTSLPRISPMRISVQ